MLQPLEIRVFEKEEQVFSGDLAGPIDIGRQRDGEVPPYSILRTGTSSRLIIANSNEDNVSREAARLSPTRSGVLIKNLSRKISVVLSDGTALAPHATREMSLPVALHIAGRTLRVQESTVAAEPVLHQLEEAAAPPGQQSDLPKSLNDTLGLPTLSQANMAEVMRVLQTANSVLQSCVASSDFFHKAAQALLDTVGLDIGRVLTYRNNEWKPESIRARTGIATDEKWEPSQQILESILKDRKTVWQPAPSKSVQLAGIEAVVASPILGPGGDVIGTLYGDRRTNNSGTTAPRITKVEAAVVELLANGVATGLARVEKEREVARARVQLEQFFTDDLSRQLTMQKDMLEGRDAVVTVLFCDIRGFSTISEHLGPAGTVRWISDVWRKLSDCVIQRQGVLVDFIGDAMMAMWGAPADQPTHAELACRAAVDMLLAVKKLNVEWEKTLPMPFVLGIGINTGSAHVGNTGTDRKPKYGPLGPTVNIASRVEGATKYLKTYALITNETKRHLPTDIRTRRLCDVRVVNIVQPIAIHELVPDDQLGWPRLKTDYEAGLSEFEQRRFRESTRKLTPLYADLDDGASLVLLSRVVQCMVDDSVDFDPVWELPGK